MLALTVTGNTQFVSFLICISSSQVVHRGQCSGSHREMLLPALPSRGVDTAQ
jgi:hypothetical protein